MKKNNFIYIIILFFFSNFLIPAPFSFADSASGININLGVSGCNKNGICEEGKENFLDCPEDCASGDGEGVVGGSVSIDQNNLFQNFSIIPGPTNATIKWNSFIPTIFILRWGENNDYQKGTLQNLNFTNNHSVELINLKSNTTYYFTIETETYLGKKIVIDNRTFTTTMSPDKEPPMNPTGISAMSLTSGITISWINPKDKDFSYIRVVRSTERYQSNPYEGKLIYEGSGQYLRDGDIKEGAHYYYTLFARDKNGNFSSGTMEDIVHSLLDSTTGQVIPEAPKEPEIKTPIAEYFLPKSYVVEQNGVIKSFALNSTIFLNGESFFTVVSDFGSEKPGYDMWIEIKDANEKVKGRYFFSDKKDDFNYKEVVVPNIPTGGRYDVLIYRHFKGGIEVIHRGIINVTTPTSEKDRNWPDLASPIIIAFGVAIGGSVFLVFRKIYLKIKTIKNRQIDRFLSEEEDKKD